MPHKIVDNVGTSIAVGSSQDLRGFVAKNHESLLSLSIAIGHLEFSLIESY